MVVTNRYFRSGARELASASQCALGDRDALVGWMQGFQTARTEAPMAAAKARSLAIRVALGSAAGIVFFGFLFSAFSVRQTPAPQAVTTPTVAGLKPEISAERKLQQDQLIKDLIRQVATREQIAEARSRLDAMSDDEFQALLASRKLMAEEQRRIERGEDESQKPPEQRGRGGSSERTDR